MRHLIVLIFALILFNCSKNPKEIKTHINGYWEIDMVELKDGTKKEYNFNESIDFIQLNNNNTGFRKKLYPNLEGRYATSNDKELFTLKIENDSLHIYYETNYNKWKETIIDADTDYLKVINQNKDVYLYKRFKPILSE